MSLIAFILFGLIIGLIARAIMPGRQSMGLLATALVGMAGSFLGGVIGNLISGGPLFTLQKSGIIGSLLGALAVLFIIGFVGRRRQAVT